MRKIKHLKKKWILMVIIFAGNVSLHSQETVYNLDWKTDGISLGTGIGLTALGQILLNKADKANSTDIAALRIEDISSFDRPAVMNNSESAQTASDIILYSAAVIPFTTFLTKKCRGEEIPIAIMALETALLNLGVTNIIKAQTGRYRPFNYNPDIDLETKLGSSSRLSFLSGHTSNTSAMSFFTAKVFLDLHPDFKYKALVWATAATIPATIGFLRVKAGKHFPTDVIAGYALGATIGYFIPAIHKNDNIKLQVGVGAASLSYRF